MAGELFVREAYESMFSSAAFHRFLERHALGEISLGEIESQAISFGEHEPPAAPPNESTLNAATAAR